MVEGLVVVLGCNLSPHLQPKEKKKEEAKKRKR